MDNNEKLLEINFGMMAGQKHKLMVDNFILLNDNISSEKNITEEEEFNKAHELMPMKFMFSLVIICKKGEIRVNVNLMDMQIHANGVLLITPGSIISKVDISQDAQILLMAFADDENKSSLDFATASIRKYFMHPSVFQGSAEDIDEVTDIYMLMRRVLKKPYNIYVRETITHYLEILTCLFKMKIEQFEQEQNAPKPTRQEEILLDFMQLVHDNCQEHRDLKFYAQKLCLSPSYLAHIISETSGRHASEWIKDAVILEAKAMLHAGSYTVQQVSLALNFPNQSFFGKYFKAAVGMSPRKYQTS